MTPILYSKNEQDFTNLGLGMLNDALSCIVKTVLNGTFELEMTYPVKGRRYADIQVGCIIKAVAEKYGSAQLFDVYGITKPLNGIITVYATHVSGRKSYIPIMPCTATSCAEVFDVLANNAAVPCPFTFYTDKNTVARFHIDTPASLGQCLGGMDGSVLDVYHGEYEFDNFTIKFWNHRGQDNGVTLRYGKNITDIQQEESIDATITGICPFYADSEGNVVVLSEKVVEAENAAKYGFKRIVVVDMTESFATQPTEADLRAEAQAYISSNNIGVPKVSISLKFENLADYEEYKDVALLEQVRLGDTVHVFFEPLAITAEARIVSTTFDVLNDKYKKVDVGSVKANMTNVVSSVVTDAQEAAEINTSSLEASFAHAIELLSGADGGNIVIRTNPVTGKPYEILIMDTDDMSTAVKVLRLNMNGLGLSTNGINGPYTAAITADGIVATAITTGILNAVRIQAGILQSQENANDPNFYLNLDSGVLKGKFSELTITGQTVNQIANGVLQNFIDGQYAQDIEDLQEQVDGQIETYFDNYVPTLSNAPANTWTTTSDKDNHLGDLFYVIDNQQHGGECYRFVKDGNTYKWQLVEDSAVANALAEALAAQAMAGQKKRVFTSQPVPPYDIGDLWVQGHLSNSTGKILFCNTARLAGASYNAADWTVASDYITDDDLLTYDESLTQYEIIKRLTNNFDDEGLYISNGHVYVNASYIKSGVVSGVEIIGQTGSIGGWTLDSERIYKERTADGITYRAALYAPQTPNLANAAFYVRQLNTTTQEETYPIRIQYDGKLIATNAEIAGTIDAGDGHIGGWNIDASEIKNQATISGVTYDLVLRSNASPTSGQFAIFTRRTQNEETTYPFALTYTGKLIANGAEISGRITTSEGSIGGWEITSTQLRKDVTIDGTTYRLRLQATDSATTTSGAFYVRVDSDGATTYPFMVRYDGSMTATNATVTGRIVAESGVIGNSAANKITIGTNGTNAAIYNGVTSFSDTAHNGFYLGADGIVLGKGKFKVDSTGVLTATGASISGSISSTSGTIGGWTIDSQRIYKEIVGTNTYRAGLYAGTTPSTNNRAFYIRVTNETQGTEEYPFAVTYGGKLTATNADITGKVTASSGEIAGWNISSNVLTKEVTGADGYTYGLRLYAGSDMTTDTRTLNIRKAKTGESSTYPFYVTAGGLLYAENANIKGIIKATSGEIGANATSKIIIGQSGTYAAIYNGLTSFNDTSHNGFYLGADGLALGKGKFKVSTDGTLTAASANITGGSINITTSSMTSDVIQLNHTNGNTKITPYGIYAVNTSSSTKANYLSDGVQVLNNADKYIVSIGKRPGYGNNGQLVIYNNDNARAFLSSGNEGGLLYLYNNSNVDVANLQCDTSIGAQLYLYGNDRSAYARLDKRGLRIYDSNNGEKEFGFDVGKRTTSNRTTGTSVSTSSITTVNQFTLTGGHTYVVTAQIKYPNNSNGRRELVLTTLSGSSYVYVDGARITQPPVDGEQTCMTVSCIVSPASNTTYYLRAFQTSGSSLSVTSYLDAVCII